MNHLTEKDYFEKVLDGDSDISIAYWNGEDWTVNGNLKSTKGILISKNDLIELLRDCYKDYVRKPSEEEKDLNECFQEFLESKNLLTNDIEK